MITDKGIMLHRWFLSSVVVAILALLVTFIQAAHELSCEPLPVESALPTKTVARDPDYVIVKGSLLKDFLGLDIGKIRLYALIRGSLAPIPFQIDECHPDGRLVCPLGKKPETDVDYRLLDDNDELVFMASDSGDRAAPKEWPAAWKITQEVEILDPLTQGRGWCYLAYIENPPEKSKVDYIDYFPQEDKYVAMYNTAVYLRDGIHRADYNIVIYPPEAGGTGVNIVDRLKLRIEMRLKMPPVTIRFNENDFEVDTLSYIDGPIRIVRRNQLYLRVPFLTIPFGGSHDVIVYRDTNDTPIEVFVPKGASLFVKSIRIRLGTDLAPAAKGMLWYRRYNPEGVIIDGLMSPAEKNMDLDLDEKERQDYWQLILGPQGAMMRRGYYNPELKAHLTTSIHYADDETAIDPPEKYPGQIGHSSLDLNLTEVRPGTYTFIQQWYHPHHFQPFSLDNIKRYMDILNHPLIVRTKYGSAQGTAVTFLKG
jgi:hypothetical protein